MSTVSSLLTPLKVNDVYGEEMAVNLQELLAISLPDTIPVDTTAASEGIFVKPPIGVYFIYDHLGNTRVAFHMECEPVSGPGGSEMNYVLDQAIDYFPYGLILREYYASEPVKYYTTFHERDQETGLDYRGARYYDSEMGLFLSVDPLAKEYPSISPYVYVANNPIVYVDPDGRYIVPVAFAQKYKMITAYLQKHVANDVMNSPTILDALASNTAADSPDGIGNLSVDKIRETVTWGSGPPIIAKDSPGGMSGANGFYDSTTGEIQLSTARLDHLEGVLRSDASYEDKFKALLPVYMTLLHETVHYGDYLDGIRQDGGEPGNEFESDVWMSKRVEADGETFDVFYFFGDKYEPKDLQEIIDEKKGQNVFPTVPKIEKK